MRRVVAVAALVLGCDVCGEQTTVPPHDTMAVSDWHRVHVAPKLVRLLAEADCDCAD